jgi:hypothetical protein
MPMEDTDTTAPSAGPELNPTQREVLDHLGASATERPTFDPGVAQSLRSYLDDSIASLLDGPDGLRLTEIQRQRTPLFIAKHALMLVHNCEGLFVAESEVPFSWSVHTAKGTIVHKAIELGISWDGDPVPRMLVDEAIASLTESTDNIGDWLYGLSERERAELRSEAVEMVTAFSEVFPPLEARWRPVAEVRLRAEPHKGAVILSGRPDLTLGQPRGNIAGKVIIDLKTGAARGHHTDDLRFYALLETLARGTPPRLLATVYLDSGTIRSEPVTEDLLTAAVRRTMDGIARIAALRLADAPAELRPGNSCRWCPARATCAVGTQFLSELDNPDRYDPD